MEYLHFKTAAEELGAEIVAEEYADPAELLTSHQIYKKLLMQNQIIYLLFGLVQTRLGTNC